MKIIIGLGNPTSEYEDTYHNMGFMVIDRLAKMLKKPIKKMECNSLTCSLSIKGENVILAKPQTYMNLSGEAVKCLMRKYKAEPSEIIVIFDDIDIEKYTVRARLNGSAGTHNGMKSIIEHIQTTNFKRIRLGIGRGNGQLKDYVLSSITEEEKAIFDNSIDALVKALVEYLHRGDFNKVMRETSKIAPPVEEIEE